VQALEVAEYGENVARYIAGSVDKKHTKAHRWAAQYITGGTRSFKSEQVSKPRPKTRHVEKFGIKVPKGIKEATSDDDQYDSNKKLSDAIGGDAKRWRNAMAKEQEKFFVVVGEPGNAFEVVTKEEAKRLVRVGDYQIVRAHWVFDIKPDGTMKARFVAGGDTIDSSGVESSMTMVKSETVRIMFTQAPKDGQRVLVADLGNAYLHSYTEEKVIIELGEEWGEHGGQSVIVRKAIYGLVGSAHAFHQYVAKSMLKLGFMRSAGEPDVWLRRRRNLWDRVALYVDDVVVMSTHPEEVVTLMSSLFCFKFSGTAERYLGSDVLEVKGVTTFSPQSYIQEQLKTFQREGCDTKIDREDGGYAYTARPGEMGNLPKKKYPLDPFHSLDTDESDPLNAFQRRSYQRYIGILVWIVQLGRIDICYATQHLGRFTHNPRRGHMEALRTVFGYLKGNPSRVICINPNNIVGLPTVKEGQQAELKKAYPWALEPRDEHEPEALGSGCELTVLCDASHGDNKMDYRSTSGFITFYGSTPVRWKSKRQATVAGSTFEAEYIALKIAIDEIKATRFLLRSMGIPVNGPTALYGDNLGVINNVYKYSSPLKKKHLAIAYHRCREAVAAGIVEVQHIDTGMNVSDIFTKHAIIPNKGEIAKIMDPSLRKGGE